MDEKNLMDRLSEVLIRNVGNTRLCKHCHEGSIIEDELAVQTWEIYKELFKTKET